MGISEMPDPPCCCLTDNGSYRPEATFSLRKLSGELSAVSGHEIYPVSLLHSNKISPAKLGGIPADTFEPFLLAKRSEGISNFLVTPLFFGPSAAAYEFIPQRVDTIRDEHGWPELEVRVAPCVVDVSRPDDTRIAEILADLIRGCASENKLDNASVALCDHGAPRIKVTEIRNFLAGQLQGFPDLPDTISPCSMERREGDEYAFNEPLLENLLGSPGFTGDVIVSMLFFQAGRHAGADGDVTKICTEAEKANPNLKVHTTDLVASHPALVSILAERLHQGLDSTPVSWAAKLDKDSPSSGRITP